MRSSGLKPENSENAAFMYLRGDRSFPAPRDVLVRVGMILAALALAAGAYFLFSRIVFVKFRDTPLVEQENFSIRNPAVYAQSLIGVDQVAMEKFEVIAPVNATDRWSMRGVLRNNARFPIDEATIAVFVSECGDAARGCSLAGQDRQANRARAARARGKKGFLSVCRHAGVQRAKRELYARDGQVDHEFLRATGAGVSRGAGRYRARDAETKLKRFLTRTRK